MKKDFKKKLKHIISNSLSKTKQYPFSLKEKNQFNQTMELPKNK